MVTILFAEHQCARAFLKVRVIRDDPMVLEISCVKKKREGTAIAEIQRIFENQQDSIISFRMAVGEDFPYRRDLNVLASILGLHGLRDWREEKIWNEENIDNLMTSLRSEVSFDQLDIMDLEGCYFYRSEILLKHLEEFNKLNFFIQYYLIKLDIFYDAVKSQYPVNAFIHFCTLLNENELLFIFNLLFKDLFGAEFVHCMVLALFHRVHKSANVFKYLNVVNHKWQKSLIQSMFLGLSKKYAKHNLDRLIKDFTVFNRFNLDKDKAQFKIIIKIDRLMIKSAIAQMELFYSSLSPILRTDLFNQLNDETHYLLLAVLMKNRSDALVEVDFIKLVLAHSDYIVPLFFLYMTDEEKIWLIRHLVKEKSSIDMHERERAIALLNRLNVFLTPEEIAPFVES